MNSKVNHHHLIPRNFLLSIITRQKHKLVAVYLLSKSLTKLNQVKKLHQVKMQKLKACIKKLINKKKIKIMLRIMTMMMMMMNGKILIYKMQMKKANQPRYIHIRLNCLNNKKKYNVKATKHQA